MAQPRKRSQAKTKTLVKGKQDGAASGKNQIRTTSVLFVEQTPGGELASRFRQAEQSLSEITGFRVKIVERNGTQVKNILHNPNPWAEEACPRPECYPCKTGEKKCCFQRNIVYTNRCIQCKEQGKESIYIGESSRSAFERGSEHINDYEKKLTDSHIYKHQEIGHPEMAEPRFEFRIIRNFQSALVRQVTEAVMISRRGENGVLNSKGVFNRCKLPRLIIEDHKEQEEKSDQNEEEEEEIEDWPRTEEYREKRQNQQRAGRSRKRMKFGSEILPRQEGIQKRKVKWTETEFERMCKRMRPEFDPELELEYHQNPPEKVKTSAQNAEKISSKIPLFAIFSKSTPIQVQPKTPKTNKKFKRKNEKSLTTDAAQARGREDIRKFFNCSSQNHDSLSRGLEAANTAASQQETSQLRPGPKCVIGEGSQQRKNANNRAEESETNWDPGLLKGEEVG